LALLWFAFYAQWLTEAEEKTMTSLTLVYPFHSRLRCRFSRLWRFRLFKLRRHIDAAPRRIALVLQSLATGKEALALVVRGGELRVAVHGCHPIARDRLHLAPHRLSRSSGGSILSIARQAR
jgi:hypothetical protein